MLLLFSSCYALHDLCVSADDFEGPPAALFREEIVLFDSEDEFFFPHRLPRGSGKRQHQATHINSLDPPKVVSARSQLSLMRQAGVRAAFCRSGVLLSDGRTPCVSVSFRLWPCEVVCVCVLQPFFQDELRRREVGDGGGKYTIN